MSSDNKKDLTRIEDLAEYLHEINEDEPSSFEPDLPETPSESETDFSSNFGEEITFNSDEDSPSFTSEEFNSDSTFSSEEPSFTTEEPSFSTQETSFTSEEPSFNSDEVSFNSDTSFSTEDTFKTEEPTLSQPTSNFETSDDLFSRSEETTPDVSMSEPTPEPEITSSFRPEPDSTFKAPENFEEIKKFAENTSFTAMGAEGNPSFSVLLRNVRYIEDVNDILSLLKELKLLTDPEDQVKGRLMRGHLLVPRISEYAAIFLAHKLRRFDIDIQVGLSDEIHPPKHQESPETGIVSKHSLYQNQTHHFQFDDSKLDLAQIVVAATPGLEGHQVVRYIGIASEHKMLDGHIVEEEDSEQIPQHYTDLAQKLKAHALKSHANAVVGLNYQLTPMPGGHKYRLTCTGNLVWVNKL